MNDTMIKFGYPENLIKEYNYWVVLIRPKQLTAASLVIVCKENAKSLSTISQNAYIELQPITFEIESSIRQGFSADKFNYLALMMVDKEVHFHVFPRYSKPILFENLSFQDNDWPNAPTLQNARKLSSKNLNLLKSYILKYWIK